VNQNVMHELIRHAICRVKLPTVREHTFLVSLVNISMKVYRKEVGMFFALYVVTLIFKGYSKNRSITVINEMKQDGTCYCDRFSSNTLNQWVSTFVIPRPGKFFFYKTRARYWAAA
jgi:hypothetical protein